MKSLLKDRNILIVGASGTVGIDIAKLIIDSGANVALHYFLHGKELEEYYPSIKSYQADISNEEECKNLIDKVCQNFDGELHQVVFASGINITSEKIENTKITDFDKIIDINLKSLFMISKFAIPEIRKATQINKWGRLIYVTSIFSKAAKEYRGAYSISKHGIVGLIQTLSKELSNDDILVNGVAPGPIWGDNVENIFIKESDERNLPFDSVAKERYAQIPLGRFAESLEVARLVRFLASDESSYITGENFSITGGAIQ